MGEKIINIVDPRRRECVWKIFKDELLKKDGKVVIFRHPPRSKKAVTKDRFNLVNLKTDINSKIFRKQLGKLKEADYVPDLRMEEGIFRGIDSDGSYFFMGKSLSSVNGNRLICFFWFDEEELKKAILDKNDKIIVSFANDFPSKPSKND